MTDFTRKDQPLVSIVIPVYNGTNYVKEAIDSALAQTYENTEIIVVNDGSTDDGATRRLVQSYGDRVRYFEKENGGVSSALNLGIREMRGKYFSWLSHDDAYEPEKVARQVRALENQSRCVAFCRQKTINAASQEIGKSAPIAQLSTTEVNPWELVLKQLFCGSSFGGCCFMIPKAAFDACGLFDESLRYVQDLLMWIRLFLGGWNMVYREDYDVLSRVHEKQLTQTGRALFTDESTKMCRMVLDDLVRNSTREDNFLYYFAAFNAKYHNTEALRLCVTAAKAKHLFLIKQRLTLFLMRCYGAARPFIRKCYYKLFRRMNTQ